MGSELVGGLDILEGDLRFGGGLGEPVVGV